MGPKVREQLLLLAAGNVGAHRALEQMYNMFPAHYQECFDKLERAGLRGAKIWNLYEKKCQQSFTMFMKRVKEL